MGKQGNPLFAFILQSNTAYPLTWIRQCLKFYNLCAILVDFTTMALPPRDQRHQYLRYEGLQYTYADIAYFEVRLTRIYRREVYRVQVFDFGGLPDLMAEGLSARMLMKHRDAQGQRMFTSRAWRHLFDIRGPLVYELILEFFSTFRFGEVVTDLDTAGALQFQLGGVKRHMSWREFILALGLYIAEDMQTDPILRLCHRLIACSIAGRSQAPQKVTVTDLFYLRGMDVGSVNGLTVIAPKLLIIDMAELVRLQICVEIDDTWAWVALGPERQPDDAVSAPRVAQDAPAVDEGVKADPAPVQETPPPPLATAKTMSQRMSRLEEDVHEIHGALTEQREVIDAMAPIFPDSVHGLSLA
ncbi:hypothetical protein Tco_1435654 [Tanacetum coccineum]